MIGLLLQLIPNRAWLYGGLALGLTALITVHVFAAAQNRRQEVMQAIALADARWREAVSKAEAQTQLSLTALQAEAESAASRAATAETDARNALKRLEDANATLPTTPSCGLDRDRARLLNRL